MSQSNRAQSRDELTRHKSISAIKIINPPKTKFNIDDFPVQFLKSIPHKTLSKK